MVQTRSSARGGLSSLSSRSLCSTYTEAFDLPSSGADVGSARGARLRRDGRHDNNDDGGIDRGRGERTRSDETREGRVIGGDRPPSGRDFRAHSDGPISPPPGRDDAGGRKATAHVTTAAAVSFGTHSVHKSTMAHTPMSPATAGEESSACSGTDSTTMTAIGNDVVPGRPPLAKSSGEAFLSGINLSSSSFDMLSLPDPPTPDFKKSAAERCRSRSSRRRQSSSSPLGARTRRGGNDARKRRGDRNSLCHVPSPVDVLPSEAVVACAGSVLTAGAKRSAITLEFDEKNVSKRSCEGGIAFDDDGAADSRKRRRARRSLMLPSEARDDVAEDVSGLGCEATKAGAGREDRELYRTFMSYRWKGESDHSSKETSLTESRSGTSYVKEPGWKDTAGQIREVNENRKMGKADGEELRRLVREFLALPESTRSSSKQAEIIERISGYPLVPPLEKLQREKTEQRQLKLGSKFDRNRSSSAGPQSPSNAPTLEDRRALLLQLGPVVEIMERRKREDAESIRETTGCVSEKTRKGRYKYADVRTGSEVRPEEYQERYLRMIREERAKRKTENILAGKDSRNATGSCVDLSSSLLGCVRNDADSCVKDGGKEREEVDERAADGSNYCCENRDEKDCEDVDMSVVMDDSPAAPRHSDIIFERMHSPESNEGIENPVSTCETVASPSKSSLQAEAGFSSPSLMLPLPSREETSSDPELAAAERRLWSSIDAALSRYSRDVLSIRRARSSRTAVEISEPVCEQ